MALKAWTLMLFVAATLHAQVSCYWGYHRSTSTAASSSAKLQPTPGAGGFDACRHYNILNDHYRNVHSNSSYYSTCDSHLNGWYRFSYMAGSRLLDQCPLYVSRGNCGAQFMGWMEGSLPHYYDGAVSRNLYFAARYSCKAYRSTVTVKNCYGFYIYHFSSYRHIPCNFRYCGYSDQSSIPMQASSVSPIPMEASSVLSPSVSTSSFLEMSTTSILEPTPAISPPDPCKNYQILSDRTRAATYVARFSSKCDRDLRGWYRFTGEAGNRMQTNCQPNGLKKCGSTYQGWLASHQPSVYEGEVYGRVCFSRYYMCRCESQTTIKIKNCGTYFVYHLYGTPACDFRYCGVKDRSSKVSCNSHYMAIDLFRSFYDLSRYKSITLRDPSCRAYTNGRYISVGSSPNFCGATKKETNEYIIYTNEVILTTKKAPGVTTRDHDEVVEFSCKFKKSGYMAGASFQPVRSIKSNESSIGSFSFYFSMFKSVRYDSYHYSFPVKAQLRENLYFEARVNANDNGLKLLIRQCYATPTMDRSDPINHVFIYDGCPLDNTVKLLPSPHTRRRFSIQAFSFLGNQSAIFIHCLVLLCQNSSTDYRCRSGCDGNRVHRYTRDIAEQPQLGNEDRSHSQIYLLDGGPFTLAQAKESSEKQGAKPHTALTTTIIALAVGMVALIAVIAVLYVRTRRSGSEVNREVKEVGLDNAPAGKAYMNEDEPDGKQNETAM